MSSTSYSALAQRALVAPNPKHHKARSVRASGGRKYQWWGSSATIGNSRSAEDLRAKATAAAKEAEAEELPPQEWAKEWRGSFEGDADALDFRAAAYSLDGDHEAEAEAYRLRNAGCQARVSVVGTASYQHTLMRVRTMGEDALFRRVKAIERAKGKHAVVKMRLFARVAFLEGLEAVADDAAASLERLVAELGDPEAEDDATGAETVNEKGEE